MDNDQAQRVTEKLQSKMGTEHMGTAWGKMTQKNGIWSEISLFMHMELTW